MGDLADIGNCYTAGQEVNQDMSGEEEQWKGGMGWNVSVKTFIAEYRTRDKIQGIFILKYLVAKHVTGTVDDKSGLAQLMTNLDWHSQ